MKKKLLIVLGLLVLASSLNMAYSKTNISSDLAAAIKLYKAGNYSECYVKLDSVLKKDESNALAYYYKAMTAAQIGRKEEAVSNYEKALLLSPEETNLNRYAKKGMTCLQSPDKCQEQKYESDEDAFIRRVNGPKFSEKARNEYEKLKIDEMRRTINRSDDIAPAKFKEYKDFSSMNFEEETPSNDKIVESIRVLQKAGLYNNMASYSDLSLLTGKNYDSAALNMAGMSSMNPQLIQALLTNNMSLGF